MDGLSTETIVASSFGLVFIVTMLVLAVKFPRPTPFQYTVFRIVLAIAVAGIATVIPGLLQVTVNTIVKAGGSIGVFVIVYFFSPAGLVATGPSSVDLPTLTRVWEGIRAPDSNNIDMDMAHKALNALNLISWYWNDADREKKRLIKDESFVPFQQWFGVLDSQNLTMSDGRPSKDHLEGKVRTAYEEMKAYV